MSHSVLVFFCFLIPVSMQAFLVGNPGQPGLQKSGVIWEEAPCCNVRLSYVTDFVFTQECCDTFTFPGHATSASHLQVWTQAGMLTFNTKESLDIYAILGGTRIQVDEEFSTLQHLSWGVGAKVLIFRTGRFRLGWDLKYIQSDQRPQFFTCDHLAYTLISPFYFDYSEIQTAVGISYQTAHFSPYLNISYLFSKLDPKPMMATVRLPMIDIEVDVSTKSISNKEKWGLSLGISLIDEEKMSLAIEGRAINQNALTLTGELRF